jgi:hypothetical protein
MFERGKLEIPGFTSYPVLTSGFTVANGFTVVEIQGVPNGLATNQTAKLYDDDDQYLTNDLVYASSLGLQSPPLPMN